MRIVIVTGEYPPLEGGVGAYTAQLASALAALGHESHILTSRLRAEQPGAPEEEVASGVTVHRSIPRWDLAGMWQVRRSLARLAPDVINVQVEPAAYGMRAGIYFLPRFAGRLGIPTLATYHDLLPPYIFPKAGRLRPWCVAQLARDAAGIIVTNREDEEAVRQILHPAAGQPEADRRLRLIPIGSNIVAEALPDFDREGWRSRHGVDRDALVVSFFGFMNRTKGLETLLEAVARINARAGGQPVHLLFIGGRTGSSDATNAQYADEIDALIHSLALDPYIHRTGFAEAAQVSAAFYAADLCALPYLEGANLRHGTLHAALAHGCPTITTTPASAIPELREGENVLLVPPRDPDALADAILTLAGDPALRRGLGSAAETLARRFTWPRIAGEVAAFANEVTAFANESGKAAEQRRRT